MDDSVTISNPEALVVGFAVSILLALAAVFIGLQRKGRTKGIWRLFTNPLYLATIIIIALAYILALSQGIALLDVPLSFASVLRCLIDSIRETFQIISLDGAVKIAPDDLFGLGWNQAIAWLYLVYQSAVFVLAPLTTFGSVAFLLFTLLAGPMLRFFSMNRDTYVLSEINSSALNLAKSIMERKKTKGEKCAIAFAEVDQADEALVAEARELGIICSDKSIDELAASCSPKKQRCFVFCSENEAKNLRAALKLTEELTREASGLIAKGKALGSIPEVLVFSNSSLSDGFVDAAVKRAQVTDPETGKSVPAVRFQRIDYVQNTINQVLMEMPLFLNTQPREKDTDAGATRLYSANRRRILIIGSGNMGYAFLRSAIWSTQTNVSQARIDVVDVKADKASERLALECPEISKMIGKLAADDAHGEAYDIEFHTMDIYAAAFDAFMRDYGKDITYVFVALGDDLQSAKAARRVRELLERSRVACGGDETSIPPIVAVIDDALVAASVADAVSPKNQSYAITPVGITESLFSYQNVFQPRLDRWARNLNAAYWGYFDQDEAEKENTLAGANAGFDALEYNRVSSRASAIFLKYHLFEFCRGVSQGKLSGTEPFGLPSSLDWTKPLDDPRFEDVLKAYTAYVNSGVSREPMQELEHRRWNAFMRTLGYECCSEAELRTINEGADKKKNLDHLARLHICLVPFDKLEEVDRMFESISGKNPRYKLCDDVIIKHLEDIVTFGR